MKQQNGFTLVEILLSLLLISFLSFAGWSVWNAHQDKNIPQTKVVIAQKAKSTTKQTDPTTGWTLYHSTAGKFSIKYPSTWSTALNPDLCDSSTFLLGPTPDTVGKCGSDNSGQVIFYSFSVESGALGLDPQYYTNIKTTPVRVDGVSGERQSGTFSSNGVGIGPANGSKNTVYIFKTNGLIYKAFYAQEPGFPDVQHQFDLIVTKTLRFN